ncbi:MAG TPA: chromosome segregation protein SMC, partial [Myxococcaceae bacterium]|nr:chromosome segregation protein SMC [Myxococcaceae bacterium]
FGLAALVALKRVEDLQWAELAVRRGDRLGDRERQVREQFETDAQPVRNAMKILGVEQPHEIVLALDEHARWAGKVSDLEKRLNQARMNPEYVAASTQLAELRAEQESLNAKLAEKGSYVRDARDVEREMARMREALTPASRRISSPGVPVANGGDGLDDFTPGLVNAAADLMTIDVPTLGARIAQRCAQYVSVLTDGRVDGLDVTHDGQGLARVGGKQVPVGQVSARDVDWVWLGLRLTLLERLVQADPMPVLIEDLATGMDEARLPMLGRMLKAMGGATQVLHVTAHPVFASMSEGSLNV